MKTNIYIGLLVCFFSSQGSIAQSKNNIDPKIIKQIRFENTIINGAIIVDNSGVVNLNIQNNQIFVVNLDDDVEKKIKLANTYTYNRENSIKGIKSEIISIPNKVIDFNDISTNKLNNDSLGLFSPATIENSLVYWQKELQTLTQKVQAQDKETNLVDTHANLLLQEVEQAVKLYEYVVEQKFETFEIKDPNTGQIEFGVKLNDLSQDPNCLFFDEFINGFARVKRNNKYGFFNQDFECVINFKFDYAENFVNGYAPVKNLGNWYYIDTTGAVSVTIPSNVKNIEKLDPNSLNYKALTTQYNYYFLDYSGNRISKEYRSIYKLRNSNFYVVQSIDNYKYGVIDMDGLERLSPKYDDIDYYNDTIVEFTVNSEHQNGLINLNNGFHIFDFNKYRLEKIQGNRIIVSNYAPNTKKKFGVMDTNFSWKLNCSCDKVTIIGNNLIACLSDKTKLLSVFSSNGKELIKECKFNQFENGYLVVNIKSKSLIIDKDGNQIISPVRGRISNLDKFGIASLRTENNTYELIKSNKKLNTLKFSEFFGYNDEGHAKVSKLNKLGILNYGIIDTLGKIIVPIEYDKSIYRHKISSLFVVSQNGKCGLFDEKLDTLVLGCLYSSIENFCGDIFIGEIASTTKAFFQFNQKTRELLEITYLEHTNIYRECSSIKKLSQYSFLIDNTLLLDFKRKVSISEIFTLSDQYGRIVTKNAIFDSNLVKIFDTGNYYRSTESISVGDNCSYRILKNFNEVGYIDCEGLKITDFQYSNKSEVFINGTAIVEKYGYRQEKGCTLGVIDLNGLEFIPPIFESIVRLGDDFKCTYKNLEFIVTINGHCISNNKSDYANLIQKYYKE